MELPEILGQIAVLGVLATAVYVWLVKLDPRLEAGSPGADTEAPSEASSLSVSQRKELAELAARYFRDVRNGF